MISPSIAHYPPNEAERLASLYRCDILHSLQEGIFDELVVLSARLFGLPISYILLLDAEQGYYKAAYGFQTQPSVPRKDLLCAEVIQQDRVVVYHDLAAAPQMPLTAQAMQYSLARQTLFYAGAPLRMPGKHAIGTLCLADRHPRTFNSQEQSLLECLADVVSQAIICRHECCHSPTLGEEGWQQICTKAQEEVFGLTMLVRYLLMRYEPVVPVPSDILHLVKRRLQDLYILLKTTS